MPNTSASPPTRTPEQVGQGGTGWGGGSDFRAQSTVSPPSPLDQIAREVSEIGRVTNSVAGEGPGVSARAENVAELVSDEEKEAALRAYQAHLELCRNDVNAFVEFVMVDEETGEYLEQAHLHVKMQAAMDSQTPGYVQSPDDEDGAPPREEEKGGARLVVMAHPESGKTNQLGIGRVLWVLGKNPNLRLCFLGNVQGGAKKSLQVVKRYIENGGGKTGCTRLRQVFPELLPSKELWTADQIIIKRTVTSKDPTIQCIGYHGAIVGSRVDGVVADDLLDFEVTRNDNSRKELSSWWTSSVMSRLTKRAWVVFLTNAWHPNDLAHELERKGWMTLRFPVLDEKGRPTWKIRWPMWRINQVRNTDMTELEFARSFMCKPRDDGAIIFQPEALERCQKRGRGYGLIGWLDERMLEVEGAVIVTGVDLAVSRLMTGGVTCMFTLYVHPNGLRQPIGVRSGRWGAREILFNLAEVGDAYGGVAIVEDNAAQRYLVDIAQEAGDGMDSIGIPVLPHTTGKNKIDPQLGISSMAAEMEAGRWVIPVGLGEIKHGKRVYVADREIRAWLEELAAYDPNTHSGDRLMASWMARTYAMRLQRRWRWHKRGDGGSVHVRTFG